MQNVLVPGGTANVEGNSFVTEQPLGTTTVGGITTEAILVVPVGVDPSDPGCEVDGVAYSSCIVGKVPSSDFPGPKNLCELGVGSASRYFFECGPDALADKVVDEIEELPMHCPGGH